MHQRKVALNPCELHTVVDPLLCLYVELLHIEPVSDSLS